MNDNKIKALVLLMSMILCLTGCNHFLESENNSTKDSKIIPVTEIKIMHRWPPESGVMGELLLEMFERFEVENPDIKLQIDSVPSTMYEEQLNVRLASDEGPLIYAFWPGGRTEAQLRKGDIKNITDLWESNGWYDSFAPSVVAGSTHMDGNIYTVPIENKPTTFWYNTHIFEEVGAKVPTTWDELMTVAQLCKDAGYVPFALGSKLTRWMPAFWFDYILLNTAGGEFRERLMWGQESWESEEVYLTFELWKEALDKGYFNEDVISIDSRSASYLVADNKAAMMLQGPWAINYLMEEMVVWEPVKDFDLFAFPVIDDTVPQAVEGSILSWAMNPNSSDAQIEAGKRFLTYIADQSTLTYLAQERRTLSSEKLTDFDIYEADIRPIIERLSEETVDKPLYMNFELATLPPVQDAGMDAFIEFIQSPEDYKAICARLEAVSRATFDKD